MGLDLTTSIIFLVGTLVLLGGEFYGVLRKGKGDTITENWRFVDKWLTNHSPVFAWIWRVGWIGFLGWTTLHFAVGIH